jgi:hypothetical protein
VAGLTPAGSRLGAINRPPEDPQSEGDNVSGRRKTRSERPLTRSQIVDAAVKIIGDDRARRDDLQAIVDRMMTACARSERTRSRQSKKQKQFAKQYSAALRKVIAMTRTAPTDFPVLSAGAAASAVGGFDPLARRRPGAGPIATIATAGGEYRTETGRPGLPVMARHPRERINNFRKSESESRHQWRRVPHVQSR